MAYKMTLADGTTIENLDYNGTHCISKTRLDPTIFTDERLTTVTITQGKDKIELSNMELLDLSKPEGSDEYYICMVQKSPAQIKQAEIERAEQETNLAVAELAIDVSTTDKTSIVNAINEVHDTSYTRDVTDTILTTQYATKFDTLTASLTARCNAIEQDVATLKNMTATTKYLNKAGEFGIFASGNTKTMDFSGTNLKANEIALRHDISNTNNTMTDKDYGNGIIDNVQKCWFTDNTDTTGLTFHYLYAGGSGRCVFELIYVATGDVIGYIVIGTSYWQSMTVDDITWSKTIYS